MKNKALFRYLIIAHWKKKDKKWKNNAKKGFLKSFKE